MAEEREGSGGGQMAVGPLKMDKAKWIGVVIAALSLIVAYLIYRSQQASQQASASSVFPVQGSGTTNATPPDLASQLGNLISMISAQNAQTQQEIAALQSQQAQTPTGGSNAPAQVAPAGCAGIFGMNGPSGIQCWGGARAVPLGLDQRPGESRPWGTILPSTAQPSITAGEGTVAPWQGALQQAVQVGKGGSEGIGPHMLSMPNGFVQHEFAPADQVNALSGARNPYRHV